MSTPPVATSSQSASANSSGIPPPSNQNSGVLIPNSISQIPGPIEPDPRSTCPLPQNPLPQNPLSQNQIPITLNVQPAQQTQSVNQISMTNPISPPPANTSSSSQPETQPSQPVLPVSNPKMTTRSQNNIRKPNKKYTLSVQAKPKNKSEPTTIHQALRDSRWRASCNEEFNAQIKNRTWDLVPPPPNQNIVSCHWIFTTKYFADGTEERPKSRLVARGFTQQYGVDFAETFSPVIKTTTLRTVLGIAVTKNWSLRQLDVNHAFLQARLSDEVYMTQPPGFIDKDRPNYVCRLNKAIYGLKQSPRAWYKELKKYLLSLGFRNSMADTSLFVLRLQNHIVYLLVYVDDIIVTGSSDIMINNIINSLGQRFSIKDLGKLHYFLGIEVPRTQQGLHLMQRKYTVDLLTKTKGMIIGSLSIGF